MAFSGTKEIQQMQEKRKSALMGLFLEKLLVYMKKKNDPNHKDMIDWIENKGGSVSGFTCRKDATRDMFHAMYANGLGFLPIRGTNGEYGFLIRSSDTQKVKRLIRSVLKSKSNYVTLMTGKELMKSVLSERGKEKDLYAIAGLSQEEASLFIDQINASMDHARVSMDKLKDGTYLCQMPVSSVRGREDAIRRAQMKAMFMAHGANREHNIEVTRNREQVLKLYATEFRQDGAVNLNDTPAYIIGDDEQYMKITEDSVEKGTATLIDGHVVMETNKTIQRGDVWFSTAISSMIASFELPRCTYNREKAAEFLLENLKKDMDKDMSVYGRQDANERRAVEKIDKAVNTNMEYRQQISSIQDIPTRGSVYMTYVSELIQGVADGKAPKGFDAKLFEEIRKDLADDVGSLPVIAGRTRDLQITKQVSALEMPTIEQELEMIREERAREEALEQQAAEQEMVMNGEVHDQTVLPGE